jgi:Uncharacterized conserved protein
MNKHGHTDEFACEDFLEELERRAGTRFVDTILYNTTQIPRRLLRRYVDEGEPVTCRGDLPTSRVRYVGADLVADGVAMRTKGDAIQRTLIRHDPDKLASTLVGLL